jgi:hypothetical protein
MRNLYNMFFFIFFIRLDLFYLPYYLNMYFLIRYIDVFIEARLD